MKIIFAQGNPGSQYAATRHNIGWSILDAVAAAHAVDFKRNDKFFADVAMVTQKGEKVLLVKPLTFYNETGRSARALVDFYKLDPAEDFLVIHDDLSLPFGTIRVRENGSSAGNNGIKSLSSHLGENYGRIRIGVWNDTLSHIPHVDMVLGRLTKDESNLLKDKVIPHINTLIDQFVIERLPHTSHSVL